MKRSLLASLVLGLITALVFALLYGPILVSVVSSFFTIQRGTIDWDTFNLGAYVKLARNTSILEAVSNTFLVGIVAVVVSTVIGTGMALYYIGGRSRAREFLQLLIFLPFLTPPIVTGLSLLIFFREIDFPRSLVTVAIGHILFVLALVYRIVLMRLQSISANLIEASYDLGASRWQTFSLVLLPNLKSAMLGAAVLAFALSFDETMITIMLTGTENTLPMRLWAMMRIGFTPDINALITIILVLTTVLCCLVGRQLMPKSVMTFDE